MKASPKKQSLAVSLRLTLFSSLMGILVACSDPAPPPPTVRSDLLLEIFDLLDRKDYEGAIPKIERLEKLDETNEFLTPFLALVRQNAVLKEAKRALNHGDVAAADKILSEYKFSESDALKKARADVKTLLQAQRVFQKILNEKSSYSKDIRAQAEELQAFLDANPIFKDDKPEFNLQILVDKRLAQAERLERFERRQAVSDIYEDAVRAFQDKDYALGNVLTQLLVFEGKEAEPYLRNLEELGAFM